MDDGSTATAQVVTQAVTRAWCEELGVAAVDPSDDFFALGGNSLIALRVAARVSDQLGVKTSVRTLFEHSELAAYLNQVSSRYAEAGMIGLSAQ